jgi:hypothetical protein
MQLELPNLAETLPGLRRTPRPAPTIVTLVAPLVAKADRVVAATILGLYENADVMLPVTPL